MKPNNLLRLKIQQDAFFRMWIEFLTPFHKLTERERDVAARVLAQYFRLKPSIQDPSVLEEVLFSETSRKDMRESLGMSNAYFQMILGKLKRIGFIVEGGIEPRYLPHIGDEPRFMLSVVFDWSSPSNPIP